MKKSYFPEKGLWLKGLLHTHTTLSDGSFSPELLIAIYRQAGYGFAAIADHNILRCHRNLSDGNIVVLGGVEHDLAYSDDKCVHLVGTVKPGAESTSYECRRYSADEISDQQLVELMAADGQLVTLCHPVWSRMEMDEVLKLQGFHTIEVFNSDSEHHSGAGSGELFWEMLLRQGRKVWAVATDDTHGAADFFGGWIVVKAAEKSEEAILNAIFDGSFYASCGPEIFDFGLDGDKVYLDCSAVRKIAFISYPPRGHAEFADGDTLLYGGEHKLTGREKYIRVVIEDKVGRCAWSNPIFFD